MFIDGVSGRCVDREVGVSPDVVTGTKLLVNGFHRSATVVACQADHHVVLFVE
ncbi:hypothetical protein D3C86_2180710 [compost metagenome]